MRLPKLRSASSAAVATPSSTWWRRRRLPRLRYPMCPLRPPSSPSTRRSFHSCRPESRSQRRQGRSLRLPPIARRAHAGRCCSGFLPSRASPESRCTAASGFASSTRRCGRVERRCSSTIPGASRTRPGCSPRQRAARPVAPCRRRSGHSRCCCGPRRTRISTSAFPRPSGMRRAARRRGCCSRAPRQRGRRSRTTRTTLPRSARWRLRKPSPEPRSGRSRTPIRRNAPRRAMRGCCTPRPRLRKQTAPTRRPFRASPKRVRSSRGCSVPTWTSRTSRSTAAIPPAPGSSWRGS